MSIRGAGLTALSRHTASKQAYNSLSSQLTTQQLNDLRQQLETFSQALRQFATLHRNEILQNPSFRSEFQRMCANIGVDPLVGSLKVSSDSSSIWNDLLGLGEFNYELGVQIVDICISTRDYNGGIIEMDALIRRIQKLRGGGEEIAISQQDVIRSIQSLQPLGCGYQVISTSEGSPKLVRSLPGELSLDSTLLLSLLALQDCPRTRSYPYLTEDYIMQPRTQSPIKPVWTRTRARNALQTMNTIDGTLWVDLHGSQVRYYSLAVVQD